MSKYRKTRFKRIYVEITSSCNLHCSFCQETRRPPSFMSVEQFSRCMEQIKPYTDFIYLHVKGEPLLHPQLESILSICQDYEMTVNITTNGTLLKKSLPILLAYPVHQINISIHSAEDNDSINMDTYFHDVFDSVNILNENTTTEISMRLWTSKNNSTIFDVKNARIRDRLHVNVNEPFEWPSLDNKYYNDRGLCQGLKTHVAILCDGTVVPCCLDGNACMKLGNIFTANFSDILEAPRTCAFIKGFNQKRAVEPLCCHCSFKERFAHKL